MIGCNVLYYIFFTWSDVLQDDSTMFSSSSQTVMRETAAHCLVQVHCSWARCDPKVTIAKGKMITSTAQLSPGKIDTYKVTVKQACMEAAANSLMSNFKKLKSMSLLLCCPPSASGGPVCDASLCAHWWADDETIQSIERGNLVGWLIHPLHLSWGDRVSAQV